MTDDDCNDETCPARDDVTCPGRCPPRASTPRWLEGVNALLAEVEAEQSQPANPLLDLRNVRVLLGPTAKCARCEAIGVGVASRDGSDPCFIGSCGLVVNEQGVIIAPCGA